MILKLIDFIKIRIWEIHLKDLSPVKAFFIKCLRVTLLGIRGFLGDRCQKTASVLTYYSLLNIVPIVAVFFGIAKGFGLDKTIEKQILQMAEKANWQADVTNQILGFSHSLLAQTKGGLVAGIGVVLLFWTVISILGKIEDSFNEIWEVRKSRTLVRKFSDYIAMMVFAPILFIISSSATVLVASQVEVILNKIAMLGIFSSVIIFLLNLLPYVSIWMLLIMVYIIMPNNRIPIKSGILGGIVAGTIFQIVQWIYIKFQIGVASYGAIYGSFAALPLFLAWLQMSWMIVLFGAEIAYASEHYETFGFQPDYSLISVSSKKNLMLRIFHLLIKNFSLGEKPLNAVQIAHTLEIPTRLVQQLLHELSDVGLVAETTKGVRSEAAFQPGRDIEGITIQYALDRYEEHGVTQISASQTEEAEKIYKHLKNISEIIEQSSVNILLKEI